MGYIEEFYYGNIETQEFTPEFSKTLKKKLSEVSLILEAYDALMKNRFPVCCQKH